MNLNIPIEQRDAREINRSNFRQEYVSKSKPLLIKGFANLYPAGNLWTFDYLDKKMGDHIVGIIDNSRKKSTAITTPDLKMKFSEFSAIIRRDEETPYRIFLFNMFKEVPEMRKDFPTPELARGVLGNLGLTFFGGKNTTVRFHYDIDCSGVLMTQVIGRKRVILIAPKFDKFLYKVPFASFSLTDPEKTDYSNFPAMRFVEGYDFVMQPGDALFMPSRYWHYNTYLEGGMAISYRILASRPIDVYNGVMNTTLRLIFDKTMNAISGEKWMERKKAAAIENANNAIKQLSSKTIRLA